MLAHLYTVLVAHMPKHYAVAEGRAVKQQGGYRHKGIEPPAGLVYGLAYEIRREIMTEFFLILKGIMPLRKGHGAAVEPAVYNLRRTVHNSAALFALHGKRIKIGLVQLGIQRRR